MKISTNGVNFENLSEKIKSAHTPQNFIKMFPGSRITDRNETERGEDCTTVVLPCGCLVEFLHRESSNIGKWYVGQYAGHATLSSEKPFTECDEIHDKQPDEYMGEDW